MSEYFSLVYKVKYPEARHIILTSEYIGLQDYVLTNTAIIGLQIITKGKEIVPYNKGVIVFDLHLRMSTLIRDLNLLSRFPLKPPIILIAHPVIKESNIFKNIASAFKPLEWEYTVEEI